MRTGNLINDFISKVCSNSDYNDTLSKELLYYSNIKELIEDNNSLLQNFNDKICLQDGGLQVRNDNLANNLLDLNRMKDGERSGMETFIKLNSDLYEEISGYETILNGTLDYCSGSR